MSDAFNRDEMARWYATQHLSADAATQWVLYLPTDSPQREIRLVEVNEEIAVRDENPLEAIDFGVDVGSDNGHCLLVVDITPSQWQLVESGNLKLPEGWSLANAQRFGRKQHEPISSDLV